MDSLTELSKQLEQCYSTRSKVILQPGGENNIFIGLETVTPASHYNWDGTKRWADPAHPFLVFQYTLAGYGCYNEGGIAHKMVPKMAFCAIIPSEHIYYLPQESNSWTYFFLIMSHPYIVNRINLQKKNYGAVMTIEPDHLLMLQAVKIFENICAGTYRDKFTQEQALFNFLIEYERQFFRLNQGHSFRENLLEEVKHYIVKNLDKPVGVMELAQHKGMSRSRFSHFFNEVTGLTPAQFIQSIRLEEAAHRLLETDQKIERIAGSLGFANSTHFCKVFRQYFHLSPTEFRRQLHQPLVKFSPQSSPAQIG